MSRLALLGWSVALLMVTPLLVLAAVCWVVESAIWRIVVSTTKALAKRTLGKKPTRIVRALVWLVAALHVASMWCSRRVAIPVEWVARRWVAEFRRWQ